MPNMKEALPVVFKRYIAGALFVAFLGSTEYAQDWEQPPRSQMNLDALERVEVRSYQFKQAGGIKMEYGVYVPTSYDSTVGDKDDPILVAVAREWVARMEELGVNYEYIEVPAWGTHSSAGRENIDKVFEFLIR
jgi:hypothetical protein